MHLSPQFELMTAFLDSLFALLTFDDRFVLSSKATGQISSAIN